MQIKELGHVVFFVSDLKRSAHFYREVLGFSEIHKDAHTALFSSSRTHHEMLLIEVGGTPPPKRQGPGLYHIGLKIGDTHEDIVRAHQELLQKGVPVIGTGDHTVTHSIYILDPDGNEIELYADISDVWKKDPKAILTPVKALHL